MNFEKLGWERPGGTGLITVSPSGTHRSLEALPRQAMRMKQQMDQAKWAPNPCEDIGGIDMTKAMKRLF